MAKNGFISAATAAAVDPAAVRIQQTTNQNSVRYFTDWALPQLDTLIDETIEPIDVWTTLDPGMQVAADRAIARQRADGRAGRAGRDRPRRRGPGDGRRQDYVDSIYNRATQATRQPGSAFKLFVYLAALESGMKPTDTIVDEPVTIDGWSPRNSTRTNLGPVTLREAFSRSINTISAKIGAQLGFGDHRRHGAPLRDHHPDLDLSRRWCSGPSDVRLIDMTRAFAAVANKGVAVTPYAIRKVVTADGRLLYQHEGDEERVLVAPWVAAEMTDLLQSAVLTGTGRAAQIGRPVAGKTGTTSSNKDGWFIGFSSGLTTGVWMGRDDARPIAGLQGGTAPARAFHDFMTVAVANRPVEQFETQVPMPDWQLTPEEEMFGDTAVDENAHGADGRRERQCRSACRRRQPGHPQQQPMVRPDGTGEPDASRSSTRPSRRSSRRRSQPPAAPAASRRSRSQPRAQRRRPIRRSRGPTRRSARLRLGEAGPEQPRLERLEVAAVVEVDEVRDLVRDDVAAHSAGRGSAAS